MYWSEQSFPGLGLEDRCSSWWLVLNILGISVAISQLSTIRR